MSKIDAMQRAVASSLPTITSMKSVDSVLSNYTFDQISNLNQDIVLEFISKCKPKSSTVDFVPNLLL